MNSATTPAKPEQDKVATTILNYNGWRDTLRCLESLRASRPRGSLVIVVDNGSADESLRMLKPALGDGEELLELRRNGGFSAGMNAGMQRALCANAQFVFVVNNDTIVEPGVFEDLIAYMSEHPGAGVTVPRIHWMSDPNVSQFDGLGNEPVDRSDLLGCAFMLRAEVLRKVGFLDETFFLYWEDRDFFQRVERGGYRVTYVPTHGRVLHKGAASTRKLRSRSSYYFLRNKFLFVRRYQNDPGSLLRVTYQTCRRAVGWRVRPDLAIRALLGGFVLWLRNPPIAWSSQAEREHGP